MSETVMQVMTDLKRETRELAEQLAAARREVKTVTEQYELACGCLSMIREDLAALMGESLDTTPDMMLNDALRVFARRQRDNLATSRAALEDVRRVVAACAIPYEALLLDEPSRKWIAPAVWETMQRAVLEARRALAQEAGDAK